MQQALASSMMPTLPRCVGGEEAWVAHVCSTCRWRAVTCCELQPMLSPPPCVGNVLTAQANLLCCCISTSAVGGAWPQRLHLGMGRCDAGEPLPPDSCRCSQVGWFCCRPADVGWPPSGALLFLTCLLFPPAQAILLDADTGLLHGVSDPRKDGAPAAV